MKLTVSRTALLEKLSPAAAITKRHSPHPFGACVLLTAADGLVIQSTAPTASVRATCPAEVAKRGSAVLGADDLLERVKALPDGPIDLTLGNDKLTMKSGSRVHVLRTHGADNFPTFAQVPSDRQTLPGSSLASVLASVAYAASDDFTQAGFNGIVISANDNALTATAADGKRIARASAASDAKLDVFIPLTVAKVLAEVTAEHVEVAVGESSVYVRLGDVELSYQRPGVAAPQYEAIFGLLKARSGPRVDRRLLAHTIRGITPDGVSGTAPIEMQAVDGALRMSHTTVDGDPSNDEIPVDSSERWLVIAEAKYLLDALSKLSGESVQVCVYECELEQPIVLRDDVGGVATIARIEPKRRAA